MVKQGYKQAELGVIPEKWTVSTIGAIADVKTGPFGSALHANDYVQDGTPIITVEHLGETGLTRQNLPKVSAEDRRRLSAYSMQEGDIVFSRVGAVDRNAYVTAAENGWLFSGRILRLRAKSEELSTRYLGYYFKAEETKERVRGVAVGQTMASLNTKLMNAFKVVLPTVEEQKNIAALLSNMDTLISTLEKQISKKKAIKQGAMLELLTGKRRLPGFEGEWNKCKLGSLGVFVKGTGISRNQSNSGNLPAVRYGELYTKHQNYVTNYFSHISEEVAANAQRVSRGDILFAASGETKEEIGKCAAIIHETDVYAGGDMLVFRPATQLNPVFMGTLLNTADVCKQRAEKGQGDAVVHIHADALSSINVMIPNIEEQQAIADILLGMDKEIELLESKLGKYRQVKQGMMQQLLTGKIILV